MAVLEGQDVERALKISLTRENLYGNQLPPKLAGNGVSGWLAENAAGWLKWREAKESGRHEKDIPAPQ